MFTSENQPENRGRPKGRLNKTTREIREIHEQIMEVISGQITVETLVKSSKPDTLIKYIGQIMPKEFNVLLDTDEMKRSKLDLFKQWLESKEAK